MITIRFSRHSYRVPDRWDDFSQGNAEKFVRLCHAFDLFETGAIDFRTLEAGVAAALLGMDATMVPKQNGILSENIFRLTEKLHFPYRFHDNEDGSRTVSVNVILRVNLLPELHRVKGYRFRITNEGMVDCDLTAEQYVDALSLMELYTSSRKAEVLDELFKVLYGGSDRGSFWGSNRGSSVLRKIPRVYKIAVYYNFRGILEWLKVLPDFRMIFATSGKKTNASSPLGLSGSIFTLSKSGYGTLQEIRSLDLMSYLGALVQLNIDGIYSLQTAGLKPGEIAEKMNLPMECVLPYITEKTE